MIRELKFAALACILVVCPIQAAEPEFDRSAEAAEIAALMRKATRDEAAAISERIYYSGISDPQLAAVLSERLLRDAPTLSLENRRGKVYVDDQYGRWMAKALSSFGREEYRATLQTLAKGPKEGGTSIRRVRREAVTSAGQIEWHAKKNAVMASLDNHRAGDEEHISRLVNLLRSGDGTLQTFALRRIRGSRLENPRLYAAMSEQVARVVTEPSIIDDAAVDANIRLIKTLSATGDAGHIPLMEKVANAKTDPRIQRHAEAAILRLTQRNAEPEIAEERDAE